MTIKHGWQGRVYEEFEVGDVYPHPLGRTVTQNDNIWFSLLTMNSNPIHFDSAYAAQTEWGTPLVNSALTLSLVMGMSVSDISQNAVNLGWDEIRLPNPLYEGDTVYAQSVGVAAAPGHRHLSHDGHEPGRAAGHHLQADGACL